MSTERWADGLGFEIPPHERTPLVEALLRIIAEQREEIRRLREEIDRLKGIPPRPQRQASSLEQPTPPDDASHQKKTKKRKKRGRRSGKRKKTGQLRIDETIPCTPPQLPEGARLVGHRDFIVQNLVFHSHNLCYRREVYQLPEGTHVTGTLPPEVRGHFGADLRAYVLEGDAAWWRQLDAWGITGDEPRRIVTEGALFGSLMYHDLYLDQPIISDDAGQFKILGYAHGLCWLHAERTVAGLVPLSGREHRALERVRGQIWRYYQRLKAYREQPTPLKKTRLDRDFDRLFLRRTGWEELNEALARLHAKKEQLLLVLEHPELPLHNNLAERDIREWAKKRKISAGTRSELGRRCRDTFLSLKKTCRKLGVSFWRYLTDRVAKLGEILPLPDLIRQAAATDTAPS